MSTTSPDVNISSSLVSWKLDHAAIRVPDLEAAVAWYAEKLDFRLLKSSPLGDKMYGFMTAPSIDANLVVELIAGPGAESRPTYSDLASSLKQPGWHHVAFRVEDVDKTIVQLKRRDVTIVFEPHDVPELSLRVAFFADPWGNLFEVIQAVSM